MSRETQRPVEVEQSQPSAATVTTLRSMVLLARLVDPTELRTTAAACRREASWTEAALPLLLHENSGRRVRENIDSAWGLGRILEAAAELAEAVAAHPGAPDGPLMVPGGDG